MCGRFTREYSWQQVHAFSAAFSLWYPPVQPAPAYNIAPTQSTWAIVRDDDNAEVLRELRWGLIPAWSKDLKIAWSTINARIETVASKPAFRSAWKQRRCLIPASGYYEWPGEGAHKRPYYIHPMQEPLLMFGAIWERWSPADGPPLQSFSIVTLPAAGNIEGLHDRMPLMLPPELFGDWIRGTPAQAAEIAHAAPIPSLAFHPVRPAVGNVRNQGRELIERV
ncbi:MAG: SOS response-associated peptidase [Xanthomonadales bacterium]|nr:SOS response-associated peptidase [Xanthomonadales bacterium]